MSEILAYINTTTNLKYLQLLYYSITSGLIHSSTPISKEVTVPVNHVHLCYLTL